MEPTADASSATYWVARDGSDIVAVAKAHLLAEENAHIAVADVIVHPEHRRRGHGTTVLATVVEAAAAHGRRVVEGWQVVAGTTSAPCCRLGPGRRPVLRWSLTSPRFGLAAVVRHLPYV